MPAWTEFTSVSFAAGLAIKSMALLAAAWLIRWAFEKQSAALRHALWMTTFVALAALLLFSAWLPALDVKVPAKLLEPATTLVVSNAHTANPAGAAGGQGDAHALGVSRPSPGPSPWLSIPIGTALLLLWTCGFAASLAPVLAGWMAMWRLRGSANPLEPAELADLAWQLRLKRSPALLEGPAGSMPMTVGVLRPAIFLPREAR
jgi:beta-lactamase regulating signal transducer with metallopeptidase domain